MPYRHLVRHEITRQFIRFSLIGTAAAGVDIGVLYAMMHGVGLDHYSGRAISWLVAATFTWALNRHFTFSDRRPALRQWAAFLAANAVGGVVNYTVYGALVAVNSTVSAYPAIGVAAGSLCGLVFNFSASKWVVFRARRAP